MALGYQPHPGIVSADVSCLAQHPTSFSGSSFPMTDQYASLNKDKAEESSQLQSSQLPAGPNPASFPSLPQVLILRVSYLIKE